MSLHFEPLTVSAVDTDADALLVSFDVAPAQRERFAFRAGQYLTLRRVVDGQDLRRSYSLCRNPDDGLLQVGIRRVTGGAFSGWAATTLRPGVTLDALPPQGRFVVPPPARADAPRHLLCIAAGSGITPVLAILSATLTREPRSRCTLVYGNRQLASTMFRDALADLKNRHLGRLSVHHVFSREVQDAPLFNGRLDRARIASFLRTLVPAASVDEAFVCGPAGMIDGAVAALSEAGIADAQVHVERFGDGLAPQKSARVPQGDAGPLARGAEHTRVTLVVDGLARQIEFHRLADASLLDAAARGGIELPYACKAGVCSTCKGRVLEGGARMARNFALTAAEVAQGFVLCCQAQPTTPRLVVTLDER